MESEWITLKDAARALDCKPDTIKDRAHAGQIKIYDRQAVLRENWVPKTRLYVRRSAVDSMAADCPINRVRSCHRSSLEDVLEDESVEGIDWITARQAADLLGVGIDNLYNRLMRDEFSSVSYREIPPDQRVKGAKVYLRRDKVEEAAAKSFNLRDRISDGRTPTVEECIYLAGLFDGEGCVQITRDNGPHVCHYVAVSIVNTYEDVILWIKEVFGGNVYCLKSTNHYRDRHTWAAASTIAYRTLQRIGPFLRIKHQQARIAIEFYERAVAYRGVGHRRLSLDEIEWREEQRILIKQYNSGKTPSK